MIKRILLVTLALLPSIALGQVYKCEVGGQIQYQDYPCPGTRAPITRGAITTYQSPDLRYFPSVRRPESHNIRRRPGSTDSYLSRLNERNEPVQAQARGELAVGMTKGQVYAMLREPNSKSNYINSNGERCERLTWYNPPFVDKSFYRANICNGKIVR